LEWILPNENKRRRGKSFELIAIGAYDEEEKKFKVVGVRYYGKNFVFIVG
jgi:hypothetical protein